MNVLFLCQRVPYPPDRGDRITTYHFLRHLLDRGAKVRVGCLAEEERDLLSAKELGKELEAICSPRIHRRSRKLLSLGGLLTGEALSVAFFHNKELQRQVDAWVKEQRPDLIYVYSGNMAQYALPHEAGCRLMQFAELDSDKWEQYAEQRSGVGRWVYRREAKKLLEFERKVARAFDVSTVCSETEKELFMQKIPDVEPVVLPNGVDVEHFSSKGEEQRDPHTVIFTGVMDYEPNVQGVVWFVEKVWPGVRAKLADAKLLIVGSRPNAVVKGLDGKDGVEVTGWVEETPPYFDQASVAIAPLHMARGIQNKVLEAMSMGLAVVSTTKAAQGLGDVEPGTLVVTDEVEQTRQEVLRLLEDGRAAREMGRRASEYVRREYGWQAMYRKLDEVLGTEGV